MNERWSADNKANRNPYAFLPFGLGPRNCVAMRFAVEEIKIGICHLVQRFRFFRVEETPVIRNIFYVNDVSYKFLIFSGNVPTRQRVLAATTTEKYGRWRRSTINVPILRSEIK